MSRRSSSLLRPAVLVAAAAALAAPSAAEAQLGRLKKAAAGAIADRAADAAARRVLGDSAAPASAGSASAPRDASSSASAAPASSRGPEKLEITSARVDTFIVAMRPLVAAARERQAFLDLQKREQEWEACRGRVVQATAMAMASGDRSALPSDATQAKIDALIEQNLKAGERMLAAAQAGNTALQQAIADSMMVVNEQAQALQYPRIATECGKKVVAPKAPAGELREDGTVASHVAPDQSATGGWSATQFGRLRERLAIYLVSPEKANDLTPEERAAIDARRADLAPFAAAFAAGTMEWQGWGDVWRGWSTR
jgi:hypothetical protein